MPRSRRDQRSLEAQQYRKLYKTSRWQRIREAQLRAHPLCQMCEAQGRLTAATVCDHVTPHKGDEQKFYAGPFASLCAPCHDGAKQADEHRGYSNAIGMDGWPLDAAHPANQKARHTDKIAVAKEFERFVFDRPVTPVGPRQK